MAGIEHALGTLRDVHGVYGSFVVGTNGGLVARDLPEYFGTDLLSEVGLRVTRLYETFISGGDDLEACVIRYGEHKLYLRAMTWGTVGILTDVGVNMPALRMAANLVTRRIDPDVAPSFRTMSTPPSAFDRPVPAPLAVPNRAPFPQFASPRPLTHTLPSPVAVHTVPPPPVAGEPPEHTPSNPPHGVAGETASPESASRQVRMYRGRPVVDDD